MKKIFLDCYLADNLGDDLYINKICSLYPDNRFIMFGDFNYLIKFYKLNNLKVIVLKSLFLKVIDKFFKTKLERLYIKRQISNCDVYMILGGSMFIEHQNWLNEYKKRLSTIEGYDGLKLIVSSNFGPYISNDFYDKYYCFFRLFNKIIFRDLFSVMKFKNLNNINYSYDLIQDKLDLTYQKNSNNCIIAPIDVCRRDNLRIYNEEYFQYLSNIIHNKIYINKFRKIYIIGFCRYERDWIVIKRLKKIYTNKIIVVNYKNNFNKIVNIFKKSSQVIGCRFHSIILGINYGLKIEVVSYSNKIKDYLETHNIVVDSYRNIDSLSNQITLQHKCKNDNYIDLIEELNEWMI